MATTTQHSTPIARFVGLLRDKDGQIGESFFRVQEDAVARLQRARVLYKQAEQLATEVVATYANSPSGALIGDLVDDVMQQLAELVHVYSQPTEPKKEALYDGKRYHFPGGSTYPFRQKTVDALRENVELQNLLDKLDRLRDLAPARAARPSSPSRKRSKKPQPQMRDKPDEKGYVAEPSDPTAYVPFKEIIGKHMGGLVATEKEAIRLLENYSANAVTWTRPRNEHTGKVWTRRRLVHLSQWRRLVERLAPSSRNPLPEEIQAAKLRMNGAGR